AWGDGGYYGRLFMNVKGREPSGTIDTADYERVRTDLVAGVEAISDPRGRNIGSRAYRPEDLYRSVNGVAPDLLVYFGDLDWRSVGAVGMGGIHTFENDTGPDEANHDWHGIFILSTAGAAAPLRGPLPGLAIQEIIDTAKPHLIIIESTGLADPEPLAYRVKNAGLGLDAVITLVDAANVERQLEETEVARAQIEAADFLVVNKLDLVDEAA